MVGAGSILQHRDAHTIQTHSSLDKGKGANRYLDVAETTGTINVEVQGPAEEDGADDQNVDGYYNFRKMVAVDKAERLVKNMSFNIDIGELYTLERSCISN